MITIAIEELMVHKPDTGLGSLSAELSCLRHRHGINSVNAILSGRKFQVQGKREVRTYRMTRVEREESRYEVGDVKCFHFVRCDRFGRLLEGWPIVVFND